MAAIIKEPFILQEISRRQITNSKTVGGCIQWGNAPLAVLTSKGINIFDYSYNLSSSEKKISVEEYSITCPKTSPACDVLPPSLTQHSISNINYNQMLIDPALWPHNPDLMNKLAIITSFQWSPKDFHHNNSSMIAVVSNMGTIELYGRQRCSWDSLLNLSEVIKSQSDVKVPLQGIGASIESLVNVKNLAQALETCAICWGPKFSEKSKCYFITAQKNGNLLFWLLETDSGALKYSLLLAHSVKVCEITSMYWIPLQGNGFLLVYSNLLGQVFGLECEAKNETIVTKKTITLWVYQDRMIVKHLQYMSHGENILLIYAKHRHLVIQMLDKSLTLLSQCHKNINQNKITVLTQDIKNLYVGTVNSKIYKVIVTLSENKLDMTFSMIEIKEHILTSEMYGCAVSSNSTIWALSLSDRKTSWRKEQSSLDLVFMVAENMHPELHKILNNPTNSLQNMWDCLELLRYKAVKLKSLPQIDYDQLYAEANTDIYKLKLYLALLYVSEIDKIALLQKIKLPETSVEKVKEAILLKHAQNLTAAYSNYQALKKGLEEESIIGANKYIDYYCKKYKCSIGYKQESDTDIDYKCESCDEVLSGFACKNGHTNMFCTITLTPVVNNYIFCRSCHAIARIELYPSKPTCTFCDLYLDKFE